MDAVELLNQHIKIDKLLEHFGFEGIRQEGDMIRACCKIHGGDNPTAFVANSNTGLWYCHTGTCGGGDAYTLVERLLNIGFIDAVRWLSAYYKVDIDKCALLERKPSYLKEISSFISAVRGRKKKEYVEYHIEEKILKVAKFRSFLPDTLQHFGLGFLESVSLLNRNGDAYTLYNRLVFPIIFDRKQVGISFRRTKSRDNPKWSHQPSHLETRNILYNYDDAKSSNTIVVCEGITDVWAFYEIGLLAVATFGAHVTPEQYKLLLKTGADLVMAYDGDESGRNATQKAIQMFKNKANIEIVHFNDEEDPENITREELKERYECRRKT